MAQRSVLAQTTRLETKYTAFKQRWLKRFFTEDLSAANRSTIALQQRAVWIGLALILQSLNEIDHDWYFPYIQPFGSLIPLALILGSFVCMWMAFRPRRVEQESAGESSAPVVKEHPARWQRISLVLTLILAIIGGTQLVRTAVMCVLPPQFSNDGTSLDTNAAILLLQGRNPYTDSNMLDMARKFSIQPNWTTPLRVGQFAGRLDYPTMVEFQSVLDTDLKAGTAPEFESKVSYPALSFLTLVPFAFLNTYNVLIFYFVSYLVIVALAWKFARPAIRPWVLLLGLANIPMWASTVGGNLDIFCTLLVILAWLLRDRRWSSAIFFGLALATKQTSWFLAPFFAIMLWRNYGFKEMLYRIAAAGALALAINLPFIIWNPQAWLAGILAPVADPMFPMGVGIIDLSITHLLPFFPQWVYSALEAGAMLLSLALYWRICRRHPESALLLAIVPLFFAWRSLSSYFYCAAFPLFMLTSARVGPAVRQSVPSFSTLARLMPRRAQVGQASA